MEYQALKKLQSIEPIHVQDRELPESIKEDLANALLSDCSEEQIRRYVHYHQSCIVEFIDELRPHSDPSPYLELLGYIERVFPKYHNPEQKLPHVYRDQALAELQQRIGFAERAISQKDIAPALKNCTREYLLHFLHTSPLQMTYRDLFYLKEFITEISSADIQSNFQLSLKLVYLNFNHLSFLAYCQENLRQLLNSASSPLDHKEIILKYLSDIRSQPVRPDLIYDPTWPGIRSMLESWLADELTFAPQAPATAVLVTHEEKLILNLSVAQIALVARLFYEEGCYGNATVTDVLKFITAHYRSKRQEHISVGSLAKEYYGIEQKTAAVVKDLFQGMTTKISRQYFPV